MSRVTSKDISYLVKGQMQPRTGVDMTKLVGPFDRVVAKETTKGFDPIFGIGGGEVLVALAPDEYIAFEVTVPKDYEGRKTYFFELTPGDNRGKHSVDIAYSTIEGDFNNAVVMSANGNPTLWIRTFNPTQYYKDATPGTKHYVNIRLHKDGTNPQPAVAGQFILTYQGGGNG